MKNRRAGFTAIELLLSVALIGLLAGLSAPVYQTVQNRNELEVATISLAQALRRAHTLSIAVEGDSSWGVSLSSGTITLFKGTTYATRDSAFDEVTSINSGITVSGTSEYVFEKFTGEPIAGETILIGVHGATTTITVNEKGTIGYE